MSPGTHTHYLSLTEISEIFQLEIHRRIHACSECLYVCVSVRCVCVCVRARARVPLVSVLTRCVCV